MGAYELNDSFSGVLANRLEYFNNNPQADKLTHLQAEIEDVKSVMVENIEKVLERGERIELLVDRTDALNSQAQQFKTQSTKLKKAMWWKNLRCSSSSASSSSLPSGSSSLSPAS